MDTKNLQEFREKLLAEKKEIEESLKRFANPTSNPENFKTRFNQLGEDQEENASEVEEYVDNIALEDNLEKQLKEIDEALEKIEKETYGICEICKKEISIDRLKAYPAAKNCMNCNK